MPKLFIANCTKQAQNVYYRFDFDKEGNHDDADKFRAPRMEPIPSGEQRAIGGELHKAQLISIVDQLGHYGLCRFDEVSKTKDFTVPFIYSEDLPIPAAAIRRQYDINQGVLVVQGGKRRAAAAIAVNKTVVEHASISQPKLTSVEFEQQNQSEAGESRIEEGFNVRPDAGKGGKSGNKPGPKPGSQKAT